MSGRAQHDPATAAEAPAIDVRRGDPSPEELAAVVAVLGRAYATEVAEAVTPPPAARSRWELSARALRAPLARDAGWGGFTA